MENFTWLCKFILYPAVFVTLSITCMRVFKNYSWKFFIYIIIISEMEMVLFLPFKLYFLFLIFALVINPDFVLIECGEQKHH